MKKRLWRPGDFSLQWLRHPLDPRLRRISPLVSRGEILRVNFYEIDQDLFIKPTFSNQVKSLASGRAAGGIFNRAASGGKGGEATLGKNTSKAGLRMRYGCHNFG